ncbi:MAG: hypothetical protein WAV11_00025 [Minisyncoccia bacterium]
MEQKPIVIQTRIDVCEKWLPTITTKHQFDIDEVIQPLLKEGWVIIPNTLTTNTSASPGFIHGSVPCEKVILPAFVFTTTMLLEKV